VAIDRDRKRRATQADGPLKLAFEIRVTVTVAFCELAMVTVAGVTVTPKSTGVPETLIADEVEEPCSASPLYTASTL